MAVGDVRYFRRVLEGDLDDYAGRGWSPAVGEMIPSISEGVILAEFVGKGEPPTDDGKHVTGRKDDQAKRKFSLIPAGVLAEIVDVLTDGGKRYGDDNWKRVPNARTRYYDALCRHVDAWWGGEAEDPQSGRSHLAHAAANIFFLMWMSRNPKQE